LNTNAGGTALSELQRAIDKETILPEERFWHMQQRAFVESCKGGVTTPAESTSNNPRTWL
jgi:hypothetical protein